MSAHDYLRACKLSQERFSALMMGAMMSGRERQVAALRTLFPELAQELDARRRSPNGRTPAESAFDEFEGARRSP